VNHKKQALEIDLHDPAKSGLVAKQVYVFEQVMPDPFALAIGLTVLVALLAMIFTPHSTVPLILNS
jgi:short-chain fatty acids transporter